MVCLADDTLLGFILRVKTYCAISEFDSEAKQYIPIHFHLQNEDLEGNFKTACQEHNCHKYV